MTTQVRSYMYVVLECTCRCFTLCTIRITTSMAC